MTASASVQIDDLGPLPVVRPGDAADLGELVRRAAGEQGALYPLGGRTMLGLGLPPARPGYGVDLTGLSGVIDYPARDMTVTVQAGVRLAELQRLLGTEKQRLPIDVPRAGQATLGGVLAANVSGPRRLGFGTLRDYLIGITTVNDEGQETKAGGRVVKNVAGYDLCKLHVGALGTLGIISQVTLKVRPRAETAALLTLTCDSAGLARLLDSVHASRTRPVCLEALNGRAVRALAGEAALALPEAPWVVIVGFEDSEDAVSWQVQQMIREVGGAPRGDGAGATSVLDVRAGAACDPLWRALGEFPLRPEARLSFKANLLPGKVAEFCHTADGFEEVLVQAHAGSGVVRGHAGGGLTWERAGAMLKELLALAESARGNVVLTQAPPDWKRELPVWGRPRQDAWLMRQVKDRLDPHRLFNPGRFIDGI
jgi:glycolate oxidase FAD binding subunit